MRKVVLPRVSAQFMNSELAAEFYCDDVLTGDGHLVTLDIPSSVSGLIRFDSELIHVSDLIRDCKELHNAVSLHRGDV